MSFWRDLLVDIKSMAVLHDDVRRIDVRVEKLDERVSSHGERLAHLEGVIDWARTSAPPRPPRLPKS